MRATITFWTLRRGTRCGHRHHRNSLRDTAHHARGRQGLAEWGGNASSLHPDARSPAAKSNQWPDDLRFAIWGGGPAYVISELRRASIADEAGLLLAHQLLELDGDDVSRLLSRGDSKLRRSASPPAGAPTVGVVSRIQTMGDTVQPPTWPTGSPCTAAGHCVKYLGGAIKTEECNVVRLDEAKQYCPEIDVHKFAGTLQLVRCCPLRKHRPIVQRDIRAFRADDRHLPRHHHDRPQPERQFGFILRGNRPYSWNCRAQRLLRARSDCSGRLYTEAQRTGCVSVWPQPPGELLQNSGSKPTLEPRPVPSRTATRINRATRRSPPSPASNGLPPGTRRVANLRHSLATTKVESRSKNESNELLTKNRESEAQDALEVYRKSKDIERFAVDLSRLFDTPSKQRKSYLPVSVGTSRQPGRSADALAEAEAVQGRGPPAEAETMARHRDRAHSRSTPPPAAWALAELLRCCEMGPARGTRQWTFLETHLVPETMKGLA
uniref:Reverse transcriptase domain-containing protein n=1 Tax=Macrostomum lignano TaxID=282301 RepID=A0A1I8FK45_9PLAT